jgi:hypothetical protein
MSEIYLNIFYALFSIFVSVIFWLKDSNKPIIKLLISMHSILLLLILVGAMYIGLKLQIYNNPYINIVFLLLLLISIASASTSIALFTGSKWYHLFHIWNLFAFLLTGFIGGMALSNDWL